MPMSLNSTMIQSIVVAIIVFLIQLLFLEFLVLANATMQREIQAHADFGGTTSLSLRTGQDLQNPGTIYRLKEATGGTNACALDKAYTAPAAGSTETLYSEDGSAVLSFGSVVVLVAAATAGGETIAAGAELKSATVPAAAASGENKQYITVTGACAWEERPEIVKQFSGIIIIIGEIIPLLLVVAVSSEAFMLVYLRGSQGGITQVVGSRVALLVIAYVVILFGSTVFEFSEDALAVFLNGIITGTERFDEISKLLLSLIPLAYELLVLGILGWNTYSTARAVRSRMNQRGQGARSMAGGF